jgi:hypothetical protein
MKTIVALFGLIMIAACHNHGSNTNSGDTTTINMRTNSPADGGPNNGLGDTNTYNRMNDTTVRDTMPNGK